MYSSISSIDDSVWSHQSILNPNSVGLLNGALVQGGTFCQNLLVHCKKAFFGIVRKFSMEKKGKKMLNPFVLVEIAIWKMWAILGLLGFIMK